MSIRRTSFAVVFVFLWCGPLLAQPEADALAHARQAEAAGKSMKFEAALSEIGKAIELDPDNHLYLAMASDFSRKAGNFAEGLEYAKKALALEKNNGAYYILAAANAFEDQNLDEARKYCKLVIERGPTELGQGPVNDAKFILSKLVPTTYTFYFKLKPKNGKAIRGTYIVALPKGDTERQTRSYEIGAVRSHRVVKGKTNDSLLVVPNNDEEFALTVKVVVTPTSHKADLSKAKANDRPRDVLAYLQPTRNIDPRSPALRAIVENLRGSTEVDTARNILAWMQKNIEYKLDSDSIFELDFKSVDELLKRGHAECRGYSLLYTALCRAAGLPTRTVWGLVRVAKGQDMRFGDIASHNWCEVYIAGVGWVPVDPQDPQTFGFLPFRIVKFLADPVAEPTDHEMLPLMNLLRMHGEDLRFDMTQ